MNATMSHAAWLMRGFERTMGIPGRSKDKIENVDQEMGRWRTTDERWT
jgi:hypothetical protein